MPPVFFNVFSPSVSLCSWIGFHEFLNEMRKEFTINNFSRLVAEDKF